MGRSEPLHPSALLVNQDGGIRSASDVTQLLNK
jgi:hypothetical protein